MNRLLKQTKNIITAENIEDLIDTSDNNIKDTTNESNNETNTNNNNQNINISEVIELLEIVRSSIHNVKESYYIFLDNLNALYESNVGVYNSLKQVVKLPSNKQAQDISKLQKDIEDALKYLEDPNYLNSIIE